MVNFEPWSICSADAQEQQNIIINVEIIKTASWSETKEKKNRDGSGMIRDGSK